MVDVQFCFDVESLSYLQNKLGFWTGFKRWFGQFHYWPIQGDYRIIYMLHIRFLGFEFGCVWVWL